MAERWRPIQGFEDLYEVSNLGNVRSLDRVVSLRGGATQVRRGRVLKLNVQPKGTKRVDLCTEDGIRKQFSVHRLVASAFIPNPESLPVVMHLDDNPSNNLVGNLRWGTQQDNVDDMMTKGRGVPPPSRRGIGTLTEADVREIKALIHQGQKLKDIAMRYGVSAVNIGTIKNGKSWKHVK